MANLIGKNVLIVDEVDDTRTTLEYAVRELEKDVEAAVQSLGRQGEKTNFSIFVLHNKDKTKKGSLPQEILKGRYIAARTVGDVWINYPWEATYVPAISIIFWESYGANNIAVISTSTTACQRSRSRNEGTLFRQHWLRASQKRGFHSI
jgi:hypoxanthine phosphoribosyltransferase